MDSQGIGSNATGARNRVRTHYNERDEIRVYLHTKWAIPRSKKGRLTMNNPRLLKNQSHDVYLTRHGLFTAILRSTNLSPAS